ncbi:MAG TPA: type IV toxin-antitoxin system AbiEi family antitoxin domain-containing protein [Nocardioides sp.]|nr:type IV toxin-antitoxin system AbiEi family antitoxin domain-containing protein [Nocardioides sp.]
MEIDWDGDAGVFLRRDALADGYDDKTLTRLVRSGVLHRIRRGAYIDAGVWSRLDAVGRHRVTARAVLRTAHRSAVLTHVSALVEHGAPVWNVDLDEVHVTRTDGRAGRREAGVVHHRGVLCEEDVLLCHGLRVSPPARAVIELSTVAGVESVLVSANWLLNHGATTREALATAAKALECWPSSLRTDLAVRLMDGRCAWPGEARTSYLIWRQHLPKPVPQYEVHDEQGRLVAVLDFAFPELGVFLEFDGAIKYDRLRRDGETLEDVIRREKRREELVCMLTGWVCIRINWEDLARPEATARRIRRVLESRSSHTRPNVVGPF